MSREIPLSDALLMVLRCLRNKIDERRLLWMNRELLGYCDEDLIQFRAKPKSVFTSLKFWLRKEEDLAAPQYRLLSGTWGRLGTDGRFVPLSGPRFTGKQVYCNIGVQQLELQLDELTSAGVRIFNVTIDPATGAEFFSATSEISRINDSVRQRLCHFINNAVQDLESQTAESGSDAAG